MELSIVMPCLNEARTLPTCIEKATKFLKESGVVGEIIVADNGSTDGSIEIAKSLGARVVNVPIKGYGAALSAGIHAAEGMYVIMGDSDDSYNFLGLQPFVDKLREGFELVMGNRFLGGIMPNAMPISHRFFGNPMLTALGRRIYENDVCGDFYCGLRGFSKAAIERLSIQSTGMEFALEMIIKAQLYQLKITEVPTTLSVDGRDRKPHLKTYRDGWRSLRLYLLMSPRWTFGLPGIVSVLLGGILFAASFFGLLPAAWALVVVILSSAAMVLGFQAILLAIFAKFIAIETGLHPPASRFWMLRDEGTLERFLIAGGVLVAVSLIFVGFMGWNFAHSSRDVRNDYANIYHTFLALVSLLFAGQTIIGGFTFGILRLVGERRQFPRKRAADGSASKRIR